MLLNDVDRYVCYLFNTAAQEGLKVKWFLIIWFMAHLDCSWKKTPNVTKCDKIWQNMTQTVTNMTQNVTQCYCTPGEIVCILNPVFPTCRFMFERATNTNASMSQIQNIKELKYKTNTLLPICQMLFTGSRLNPKAVKQNIFLLLKNTVNWKGFQHCELKRRTSMFTFSTQASPSKRHQSISGYLHTSWCTLVQ